jgi:glycogen debranching enzyme
MVTVEASRRLGTQAVPRKMTILSPSGLPSSERDLARVRIKGHGTVASGAVLYAGGQFVRDGTETSQHTLMSKPEIARDTLHASVRNQGVEDNPVTEEANGREHHEHRDRRIIKKLVRKGFDKLTIASAKRVLGNLSQKWGGDGKSVTYYGAVDTTPKKVILVNDYNNAHPRHRILEHRIRTKNNEKITVEESTIRSLRHVTGELKKSSLGLLEYKHQNRDGIQNQYFKDSLTSLIFADSERHVNFGAPIAEIGVQGITYDALEAGKALLSPKQMAEMVSVADLKTLFAKPDVQTIFEQAEIDSLFSAINRGDKTTFDGLQKIIQRQVLRRLWLPDEKYFASAIDRDPHTKDLRIVDSIASNPAALLNTAIFDDLSVDEKKIYVGGIATMITGPEFWTEAGHRGRALRHKDALRHPVTGEILDDYHGVFVVWPNENYNTAQGFQRQGLTFPEEQLKIRHTNSINILGKHSEFFLVDIHGRLQVHKLPEKPTQEDKSITYTIFNNSNHSEDPQTWVVSSSNAIKRERGRRARQPQEIIFEPWQYELNDEIRSSLQEREEEQVLYKTKAEIERARANGGIYHTDSDLGIDLDNYFRRKWGAQEWESTIA